MSAFSPPFSFSCACVVGSAVGISVLIQAMRDRYWWVLLGVAVLAMAGGGDK